MTVVTIILADGGSPGIRYFINFTIVELMKLLGRVGFGFNLDLEVIENEGRMSIARDCV